MSEMIEGEGLKDAFKGAMRRLASGVIVATVSTPDGPIGMAATSITSLTFDPLAVLLCVNQTASLHAHLSPGAPICLNLLSREQKDVSMVFGSSAARDVRFATGTWGTDLHGSPMLDGAQCNLSCTIDSMMLYGTHSIVIAKVDAVRLSDSIDPLIYLDGKYL